MSDKCVCVKHISECTTNDNCSCKYVLPNIVRIWQTKLVFLGEKKKLAA